MIKFALKCWDSKCAGVIDISCQHYDQAVSCVSCKQVATFVNLATLPCPFCGHFLTASLTSLAHLNLVSCENCLRSIQADLIQNQLRLFPLSSFMKEKMREGGGSTLEYCGRDMFEGLETEVAYARTSLERATKRGFFRKAAPPAKSIFIRMMDPMFVSHQELPISELRLLHGYCNFKFNPAHENAKFTGTTADFGDGYLFRRLVEEHGLVNAYFERKNLMECLMGLAPLLAYRKHFKLI